MNSSYSIFASLYDPKGYKLDLESCFDVSEVEKKYRSHHANCMSTKRKSNFNINRSVNCSS